ncbi:hypothetical protein oki361_18220 [Helicobacter pylori]
MLNCYIVKVSLLTPLLNIPAKIFVIIFLCEKMFLAIVLIIEYEKIATVELFELNQFKFIF